MLVHHEGLIMKAMSCLRAQLMGMCRQVSSRLSAGPQAARASADMRGSGGLRQSISGALQRVSGIRSPSGATESGEPPVASPMHKAWQHLSSLVSAASLLCVMLSVG